MQVIFGTFERACLAGQDQLDANAVRSACKDLAKMSTGDVLGNTARILSVVLCAVQVTSCHC